MPMILITIFGGRYYRELNRSSREAVAFNIRHPSGYRCEAGGGSGRWVKVVVVVCSGKVRWYHYVVSPDTMKSTMERLFLRSNHIIRV